MRRALAGAVVALAVAGVVAGAAIVAGRDGGRGASEGGGGRLVRLRGPAPAFALPEVREGGATVRLADFAGRPVVVNFFASWCVPCRAEMPAFEAVARSLDGRVAFVGIDHRDSRRLARRLLDETGVSYPAAYDPGGSVAAAYRLFGMPTTVFVGPGGTLVARRTGEMSRAELERALGELFGVRAGDGR